MQAYRNPRLILKKTSAILSSRFPLFGPNKKQEIIRLVFEISKRENISPGDILSSITHDNFHNLKNCLLRRRFPLSIYYKEAINSYLPKVRFHVKNKANIRKTKFYPAKIIVEDSLRGSFLLKRFRNKFPLSKISYIKSLKEYRMMYYRRPKISDYNQRRKTVFITKERYDLFKKCPCTKGAIRCDYHIFNLGFGCIFDCTYCYLQEYTNTPGIILSANLDRFFDNFIAYKKDGMRIGTGEFSDSLMLDDITQYSKAIIDFFRKHPKVVFEFKTKSANIKNLLSIKYSPNIVVSWSLNPQRIIKGNEFFTAGLIQRLDSARKCADAGYKIGFHFDPVFFYKGWRKDYKELIDLLFLNLKTKSIAWISIGTFRFTPKLKDVIEERFPENKILNEELLYGYDKKLRYPDKLRVDMYANLIAMFRQHNLRAPIYLCMEEKSIWQKLSLSPLLLNKKDYFCNFIR